MIEDSIVALGMEVEGAEMEEMGREVNREIGMVEGEEDDNKEGGMGRVPEETELEVAEMGIATVVVVVAVDTGQAQETVDNARVRKNALVVVVDLVLESTQS